MTAQEQIEHSLHANKAASVAATALLAASGEVFVVGGAVRDSFLGREPGDIDLLCRGIKPATVRRALECRPGRVDLTGKDFGVFRFRLASRFGGGDVEIALPRTERSTGDQHTDFDVLVSPNLPLEVDLKRRDFTCNAIAFDIRNKKIIDPFGGIPDIEEKSLVPVFSNTFVEDPLRILRALVAWARFGFKPTDNCIQLMREAVSGLEHLSVERVQAELDKLFAAPTPAPAILLAQHIGALKIIAPALDECFGFDQNNPHHELELGTHLCRTLARVSEVSDDRDLRIAALLHDIGKPQSAWEDPETGTNHFYKKKLDDGSFIGEQHEDIGALKAAKLLLDLRFPNDRVARIVKLIRHHMWASFSSRKGARKFLNRVGDCADDLFVLRWADNGGRSATDLLAEGNRFAAKKDFDLKTSIACVNEVRQAGEATSKSDLAVNGRDLIEVLGFEQGPIIGETLNRLEEIVLDDPEQNEFDNLLTLAQKGA